MHDSSFGRLISVLVSPGKTFESIAQRPTWVVPLLVMVILSGAVVFLMFQNVDFSEMLREQAAEQGQEAAQQVEGMGGFIKGCAYVSGVLGPVIVSLIVAGIFMVLNFFGGQLRYPVSLSVLLYSGAPRLISLLLSIPVLLFRGESLTMEEIQSGQLLQSNLGFLAPEDAGPMVKAALASLDLFSLWSLVLMIIGYHIAARVSKGAAAGVAIAVWILGVLLAIAGAAMQGLQGG